MTTHSAPLFVATLGRPESAILNANLGRCAGKWRVGMQRVLSTPSRLDRKPYLRCLGRLAFRMKKWRSEPRTPGLPLD